MTMQNDATGKQPTVAEEMAKFSSVAFKDGEVSGDTRTDGNADQQAREARAAEVNGRSHEENVAAGKTGTEGKPADQGGDGKAATVELTDAEKTAAIEAAEKAEGGELSDEEKEAVLATALASKQRTAAVAARKAAKAARYNDNHRAAKAAERRAEAAERRADALERRLAALEGGKPLTEGKPAGKDDDAGKPDPTDTEKYQYGELDPKYLKDLARYEALAAVREDAESKKTASQAAADKEAQEAFQERVATFAEAGEEEFEDFHETVMETLASKENPDGWPCSATLGELLMESEHGPAIAYALATDVAEARRVYKMSEPRQAIWFGKKEAELDTAGSAANGQEGDGKTPAAAAGGKTQAKPAVRESKAPPPPSKVQGGSGNKMPNAATTDFAAFESMAMGQKR